MSARITKLGMLLALTTLTVAACDDDPVGVTPPTMDDVAGEYVAEEGAGVFTVVLEEDTTDLLEAGAILTLVLDADGTTSGSIFVPGWGDDEGDLEADLDGIWELAESTVTLEIDAGTFLDGLSLIWTNSGLSASGTLDDDATEFELALIGG